MDHRSETRDFLTSRRARITPEQAGLPAYGTNRLDAMNACTTRSSATSPSPTSQWT